ncbi:hypothetical protein Bealeia1_00312 [Candidatus Bealeia paramacronuclearis]|uniref:Uncharacterized protein n=1 Tax=Candidatus Bealeia paramacronuclearis TaxID=1921001 RepID=A0ABZ2C0U8_9PROT|nr:hypothetical protein [Candidatus Bealeia paramacronuclearis]
MKKDTLLFSILMLSCVAPLQANPGFNCPKAETISCKIFDQDPKSFVCTSESVNVGEGTKVLGSLPFYGPPVDIIPGFDFAKAQWELVLGEYSYGFPDCVYQDKITKTQMNFIYRPEDLKLLTPLENCKFQDVGKAPHIVCE